MASPAVRGRSSAPPDNPPDDPNPEIEPPSPKSGVKLGRNWELFESWIVEMDRHYESEEEKMRRFGIFCETLKRIDEFNRIYGRGHGGATFGLNIFSDRTKDERPRGNMGNLPELHEVSLSGIFTWLKAVLFS